jgi:hypothetical protein
MQAGAITAVLDCGYRVATGATCQVWINMQLFRDLVLVIWLLPVSAHRTIVHPGADSCTGRSSAHDGVMVLNG